MRRTRKALVLALVVLAAGAGAVWASGGLDGGGPDTGVDREPAGPADSTGGGTRPEKPAATRPAARKTNPANATWRTNAKPTWSGRLAGFQVRFTRAGRRIAVETPDWVSLRCTRSGSRSRSPLGGFGLHFASQRRSVAARSGRGGRVSGRYTARGDATSVLRMRRADLPEPAAVTVAFSLRRASSSVAGRLSVGVRWSPEGDPPYSRCDGSFAIRPR